jgi:hypothetical protein
MTVKELRDILNELIEYEYGDCEIGMRRNGYHSIDFYALEFDDEVTRVGLSEGVDPDDEGYPQE